MAMMEAPSFGDSASLGRLRSRGHRSRRYKYNFTPSTIPYIPIIYTFKEQLSRISNIIIATTDYSEYRVFFADQFALSFTHGIRAS